MTRIPAPSLDIPMIKLRHPSDVLSMLSVPDLSAGAGRPALMPYQADNGESPANSEPLTSGQHSPEVEPSRSMANGPTPEPSAQAREPRAQTGQDRKTRIPNTPKFARQRVVVRSAAQQMHKWARTLSSQSPFGWQRTVLLVLAGAALAYGVTGGWKQNRSPSESPVSHQVVTVTPPEGADIRSMQRAPLRVETAMNESRLETTDVSESHDLALSTVVTEAIGDSKSSERPRLAGTGPLESVPSIRRYPLKLVPAEREEITPNLAETSEMNAARGQVQQEMGSHDEPRMTERLRRETVVEQSFQSDHAPRHRSLDRGARDEPSTRYPRTDPSNYRDPEYVVPWMATRSQEPRR